MVDVPMLRTAEEAKLRLPPRYLAMNAVFQHQVPDASMRGGDGDRLPSRRFYCRSQKPATGRSLSGMPTVSVRFPGRNESTCGFFRALEEDILSYRHYVL